MVSTNPVPMGTEGRERPQCTREDRQWEHAGPRDGRNLANRHGPASRLGIKKSSAGPWDRAILYERGDTQFIARIVVGVRAAARVSTPAEQIQNRSQDQTCVSELQPHCQPC